ncbi:MAG TPA: phytoene/squalene synthase family protein [Thermoguttaceae bacterium]|nr:phytoene/squalene synthase family protein [Thermoguttaceae bacterium]
MTFPEITVESSYRFCHAAARRAGSNFYPCFLVLPGAQRRAMEAIYAFMRHTDDLGDRPGTDATVRITALRAWRDTLDRALGGESGGVTGPERGGPENILPALGDAVRRFAIPPEHLRAVIDGVEMDVHGTTYETFDELAEYCHRVASAVGLACIHVWGFHGEEAIQTARHCGLAFQLTNILRDLKEDAAMGRVYLPREDFRRCDYSVEALRRGEADEAFLRLMRMEIDRAEAFYREGARLFDHLERPGQRIIGLMFGVYHGLLRKIASDPAAVLSRRVRVGRMERLRLAARWLLLPPGRRALP